MAICHIFAFQNRFLAQVTPVTVFDEKMSHPKVVHHINMQLFPMSHVSIRLSLGCEIDDSENLPVFQMTVTYDQ